MVENNNLIPYTITHNNGNTWYLEVNIDQEIDGDLINLDCLRVSLAYFATPKGLEQYIEVRDVIENVSGVVYGFLPAKQFIPNIDSAGEAEFTQEHVRAVMAAIGGFVELAPRAKIMARLIEAKTFSDFQEAILQEARRIRQERKK